MSASDTGMVEAAKMPVAARTATSPVREAMNPPMAVTTPKTARVTVIVRSLPKRSAIGPKAS